jgi:hypothetical protein
MDFDKPHGPRVFYPMRRGVLITEEWFCAQQRRVAVKDVGQVGWRQSSTLVTRRVALRIVAIEMALVVSVAFLAISLGGPSLLAYALAGAHLVGVILVTWYSAYRYPGPLQLWAEVRGQPRLLLSSTEQTEFHKIRRALDRAVEYRRELARLS